MRSVVHRWVRQPNLHSDIYNRVANRFDPFNNTLTVLEDPNNQRKLYLIGTTNSSTTLAHRTKKLISEVAPNALYVQTTPQWWNSAKHTTVNTQEEFAQISKVFQKEQLYNFENNLRGIMWRLRFYVWAFSFKVFSRFPTDFRPFDQGLETKFAIEQAKKSGAKTVFGGHDVDAQTMEALRVQPDMYPILPLWRLRNFMKIQSTWTHNYTDWMNTLHTRGGQAFAESCDRSRINFLVAMFNKIAPKQKKILVDWRGQRVFRDIYNIKQKTVVAVVNQWHMQAIQTHWRRATGTQPIEQALSPVADMDIDGIQQNNVVNDFLRGYTSDITKSQPATHQNHLISYHKENFEYERTRHTHHQSHEDIPEPGQKHNNKHH